MNDQTHVPLPTPAVTVQSIPSGELVIVPLPFPVMSRVTLAHLLATMSHVSITGGGVIPPCACSDLTRT